MTRHRTWEMHVGLPQLTTIWTKNVKSGFITPSGQLPYFFQSNPHYSPFLLSFCLIYCHPIHRHKIQYISLFPNCFFLIVPVFKRLKNNNKEYIHSPPLRHKQPGYKIQRSKICYILLLICSTQSQAVIKTVLRVSKTWIESDIKDFFERFYSPPLNSVFEMHSRAKQPIRGQLFAVCS